MVEIGPERTPRPYQLTCRQRALDVRRDVISSEAVRVRPPSLFRRFSFCPASLTLLSFNARPARNTSDLRLLKNTPAFRSALPFISDCEISTTSSENGTSGRGRVRLMES